MVTKTNWYNSLIKWVATQQLNFQKWRYKASLKKAIKHANYVKNHTSHKCIVLFVNEDVGFKAFKKKDLKVLVKSKYFKKGTTAEKLESMAVYTTN